MGEQRRSQRFPCEIAVSLREGKARHELITRDVSRHGLFVRTSADLTERNLVQLQLGLPDGPLPATAFVARNADSQDLKGAGLQFFALSQQSKQRWDDFIYGLNGKIGTAPTANKAAPDTATFLVKLKDEARLLEFLETNLVPGAIYLATPVLQEQGAEVALVLIHPTTEEEFTIVGKVRRVRSTAPKGMDIRFRPSTRLIETFREFVHTGQAPRSETADVPEARTITEDISLDIVVDEDALEESARFEWGEVSDYAKVLDLGLGNDGDSIDLIIEEAISADLEPMEATVDMQQPQAPLPPPQNPPNGAAEQFPPEYDPASATDSADVFVTDGFSMDLEPERDAVYIPEEVASADLEIPELRDPTDDLIQPQVFLRIYCEACDSALGQCVLGGLKRPLGLLAELKAFWSPDMQRVVSVPRLKSGEHRRGAKQALGNNILDPVSLETLFQVAELASPPTEPSTGGKLRVNRLVEELRQGNWHSHRLRAPCPVCSEAQLVLSVDD